MYTENWVHWLVTRLGIDGGILRVCFRGIKEFQRCFLWKVKGDQMRARLVARVSIGDERLWSFLIVVGSSLAQHTGTG